MAKKRPSVHKRQREHLKRQKALDKADKAAKKKLRRETGNESTDAAPLDEIGPLTSDDQPTAATGD